MKEVWVKGYFDKQGDIVIPTTDFGGRHIIPKSYFKDTEFKVVESVEE